jgi:16S rRNA (guanine1207-N2)-methyltransferase
MKKTPEQHIISAILEFYAATSSNASTLWFVDDNIEAQDLGVMRQFAQTHQGLQIVSNRFDKYDTLKNLPNAFLSDFCLPPLPDAQTAEKEAVFFRVAKEKPVNMHLLNQSYRTLSDAGRLIFCGAKNDGMKSLIKHAESRFGCKAELCKIKPDLIIATITKHRSESPSPALDDRDYDAVRIISQLNEINGRQITPLEFYSKPGVFGWDKIDKGSEMLTSALADILATMSPKPSILLDLGCGYGYIAACAARLHNFEEVVATDNNVSALLAAKQTFAANEITVKLLASDAGRQLDQRFELILCNPPFHQGFNVDGELTRKFLDNTRRLLSGTGTAIYVVNSFIALEKHALQFGLKATLIDNSGSFKLIALNHL